MSETIILVSLIIGFFAITIFALGAMLAVRRREQNREDVKDVDKAIAELDSALNAALNEINRLGALVQKEVDEKYQAMLFLYNMVDDKQKEMADPDGDVVSEMLAQYLETHGAKLQLMPESPAASADSPVGATAASASLEDAATNALTGAAADSATSDEPPAHDHEPDASHDEPQPITHKKRPSFANPRHKRIWELSVQGRNVPDIAKELGMGQGEVKLILDLAERAS